jgi:cobalt-zinc-cadmium efflux system outer membrane protein
MVAGREWTIEAIIASALSQQPLVEAARARMDAARADRVTAGLLPNPVGTVWMENAGIAGQRLQGLNREISAYVTLPIEPFFQRSTRIRRADEDVKASQALLALSRRQVAADAVRAFFRVAWAQEVAEETEHERSMFDRLRAYNRARVDEGVMAGLELMRVQVEHDRAATDVAIAEADLARGVAGLSPYLGPVETAVARAAGLRVVVPGQDVSNPLPGIPALETVLARARERRPEVVAGRARTTALTAAEDYERTLVVRQVGATIGGKHTEGQTSMVAAVSVAVPLFNRNQGGVARAINERLAAEQDLAWTDRMVAAEVQGAHESAIRLTRQLRDLQPGFLGRAEEVEDLTLGAYQEGGATLLQVLDATRLLADAHLTYARVLFAQRQALFELALATGAEPSEAVDLLREWSGSASTIRAEAVR